MGRDQWLVRLLASWVGSWSEDSEYPGFNMDGWVWLLVLYYWNFEETSIIGSKID